jgi:hypothetical protein
MKKPMFSLTALVVSLHLSSMLRPEEQPVTSTRHVVVAEHEYRPAFVGDRLARTELSFGTAKANHHPPESKEEFHLFPDTKMTPTFPDGLTVLKGLGRFQGSAGITVEETSFLVLLLSPAEARRESSEKIDTMRRAYEEAVQQESVPRSDFCCKRVGF